MTQDFCVKKSQIVLDDTDHHLLDELQADAGRTLRELGDLVGLSPSAVQRRMGRYRASGLLSRTAAVLDPSASPDLVLAVCLVQVERESRRLHEAFNRRLLATPEVQQAYTVYGEWDYVVVLAAGGMAHFNEVSERLFMDAHNVRKYSTLFVVDPVRTGAAIPTRALRP
ncbi:Lrp/AsnC family transcriptional regulator [Actinophytocola sp. S1-96]|uniref:Lrp/AsnC family transcriptional regulator n=1 Tax=Actinophytocola gossypii TaxID=2812003 RepID=A0ABT2JD11_9PSEU|nr:Lrp/AsnC family transcriptional regulator [Actinophytocola gossypii]